MEWIIEGMNYWDNPNCPRKYLEDSLIEMIFAVEGTRLEKKDVKFLTEDKLRKEVSFYEYVSDK